MKKKLLFAIIFLSSFFCFASTAPYDYTYTVDPDYDYMNIERVFIISNKGADVKEKPDENSRTLFHIPPATQVRVVAITGPKSNNKSEYYSDYYLNWCAIFLPDNLRINGNQIGWINNPDDLWWSTDEFSSSLWETSKWKPKDLNGYLLNHVWEMTLVLNGEITTEKAIVVFEKDQAKGLYFKSDSYSPEEKVIAKYKIINGNQIEITEDTYFLHKGIKNIEDVGEDFFTVHDNKPEYYYFRAINPGTILIDNFCDKYNKDYLQQMENYIIKESRKFFRIYSKDYYSGYDISDYLYSPYFNNYKYDYDSSEDTMKNPYNLKTLAIAYGVWLKKSDTSGNKLFYDYWNRYIKKYEQESLPKGIYTYRGICKPYENLYADETYKANSNLNLREAENRTSQVITVINENTKVTVIEFGQPEIIEGILSTWVKVKIVENTVDKNNAPLAAGTEGWCFGGYLTRLK